TALEIAVPHFKELVSPENARDRDLIPGEHRKNLACSVIVRLWNFHLYSPSAERTISAGTRAGSSSTLYPRTYRELCWFPEGRPAARFDSVASVVVNACHVSARASLNASSSSSRRTLSRMSAAVSRRRRLLLGELKPAISRRAGMPCAAKFAWSEFGIS